MLPTYVTIAARLSVPTQPRCTLAVQARRVFPAFPPVWRWRSARQASSWIRCLRPSPLHLFSSRKAHSKIRPRRPATQTYEVTGDITLAGGSAVQSASLNVPIILTDGNGKIVGADFYQPDDLPATLDPGAKFRVDDSDVIATAAPAADSITAGIDPTS